MIDKLIFKRIIKEKKLKQYEVALKAGMAASHLSNILNGNKPDFALVTALKIAKAIDTPLSVLTGEISIEEWKALQAIKNIKKQ